MLLKFVLFATVGLTVFISQPCEAGQKCSSPPSKPIPTCPTPPTLPCPTLPKPPPVCPIPPKPTPPCPPPPPATCDTKKCGLNEVCTTCDNPCNTHTCSNPGTGICPDICKLIPPTCICEPNYARASPGAPCTPLVCPPPCKPPPETCDTKKCGPNEVCTTCAPNACNTYSCANPGGLTCKFACIESPPRCMCKPNFARATPDAPCTPLVCPSPCKPPETCDTKKCGPNEVCTTCAPNACNTYDCSNPDGKQKVCTLLCALTPPTCICKPNYARASPGAPCTPLICPPCPPPPETCDTKKCGPNEVCAPCGPDACNTYDCKNPDGKGVACPAVCSGSPTCICKPNYARAKPGAPCTPLICPPTCPPPQPPPPCETCDTKICAWNEVCTTCKPNACNTYDCSNRDGKGKVCPAICILIPPTCICKPNYARAKPGAPCTPLICPPTCPPPPPPCGNKCGDAVCGVNEECSGCGQNECNTYTCEKPTPSCVINCLVFEPKCVCKPRYHRETPCGPCVPLKCPC